MTELGQALSDYLALRRSLGYKLELAESLLSNFVKFVEEQGSAFVTTKLTLDWANLPTNASVNWKASRLSTARSFAKYLSAFDSRTEIASQSHIRYRRIRQTPYLYSEKDIQELLKAPSEIFSSFKVCLYTALIGLLAVTGMRVRESITLNQADIDWDNKLLVVRESKFGKSRELVLHRTTFKALGTYAGKRDQTFAHLRTPSFFVSPEGRRLHYADVHKNFHILLNQAGLSGRGPRTPRIHDLRHSFALKTLVSWYKAGLNVEAKLPLLSTYLGHVNPTSTYWYLTATPELLLLAAQRRQPVRGVLS